MKTTAVRMREGCAGGGKGPLLSEELSLTIATSNDQILFIEMKTDPKPEIPEIVGTLSDGAHMGGGRTDKTPTQGESSLPSLAWALQERDAKGPDSDTKEGHLIPMNQGGFFSMAVRRLTPKECERLQGFPDNYTLIPFRGKPVSDGPRYKALGNSMAVPVMRWIGERIELVESFSNSTNP